MRTSSPSPSALLCVTGLTTTYPLRGGRSGRGRRELTAVDDVSFAIAPGETLAIVGESGCGKTTVGLSVLGLVPVRAGRVEFDGYRVTGRRERELRRLRREMQVVFQDPFGSLDPRRRIGDIVGEGLTIHGIGTRSEREERVARLLDRCGLEPAAATRYPHEFSGGQRQRIGIARALALEPRLVVCDEPVSSLDVSIRAEILTLLAELREEHGLTYLFITHDLSTVEAFSDRIAVMYLGRIVEEGATTEVFRDPLHPYTRALLAAIPGRRRPAPAGDALVQGDPPSPLARPSGCAFHPRCPIATEHCRRVDPPETVRADRRASCHAVEV